MEQLILVGHIVVALGIVALIMLQQGKGADMGASFGAGASQTLFGSDGSGNVLTKATTVLAIAFFATSLGLAILAKNQSVDTSSEFALPISVMEAEPVVDDISTLDGDVPSVSVERAVGRDIPEM
jgi:preprotein translocase subunit SecG